MHLFVEPRRLGEVFYAPIDVYLGDADVLQPDVVFVAANGRARVEPEGIHGAPELVVEVLSPSTMRLDLVKKVAAFARAGVREAWYVDLEIDEVRIHRYEAGASGAPILIPRGGVIETPLLPGLSLSVDEVLGPPEPE